MAVENQKGSGEGGQLPLAAMIALVSLAVALAALWFAFSSQQQVAAAVAKRNQEQAGEQGKLLAQLEDTLQIMSSQQRESRGFMVKQYHYSQLMQLLSQTYVLTERLEPAALVEVHLRTADQLYAIEPFLSGTDRNWLSQQLKEIENLSTRLADPLQDYEENLLTTKTTLRNMIDETRDRTYAMLFPQNLQGAGLGEQAEP